MRRALGWQPPTYSSLSPEDVRRLQASPVVPIQNVAWEKLCSLFTVYRLIDVFEANGGLSGIPPALPELRVNESRQRRLTEESTKNIRGWDKLRYWPKMLADARKAVERLNTISRETLPNSASDNPHIGHLAALSRSHVRQKYENLADNFQAAAMHLSYMMKMPGMVNDGNILPDIPDRIQDLLNIQHDTAPPSGTLDVQDVIAKDKEAIDFLGQTSALHLRLPLQLALAVSPLYLISLLPLHKSKCDRSLLLKVAEALGNVRPRELREIEREILASLLQIACDPQSLKTELMRLVTSDKWKECETLSATDPAANFFNPSYAVTSSQLEEVHVNETDSQIGRKEQDATPLIPTKEQEGQPAEPQVQDARIRKGDEKFEGVSNREEGEMEVANNAKIGGKDQEEENHTTPPSRTVGEPLVNVGEGISGSTQRPERRLPDVDNEENMMVDDDNGEGEEVNDGEMEVDKGQHGDQDNEEREEMEVHQSKRIVDKDDDDEDSVDSPAASEEDEEEEEDKEEEGDEEEEEDEDFFPSIPMDKHPYRNAPSVRKWVGPNKNGAPLKATTPPAKGKRKRSDDGDDGDDDEEEEEEVNGGMMEVDKGRPAEREKGKTGFDQVNPGKDDVNGQESEEEEEEIVQAAPKRELRILRKSKENEDENANQPQRRTRKKRKRGVKRVKFTAEVDGDELEDEKEAEGVIDVDLWTPRVVTLSVKEQPSKMSGRKITVHGPMGEITIIEPKVHDQETLKLIDNLWTHVESAYQQGKPVHLSNPKQSAFHVVTHEKQKEMDVAEWLNLVETKNVVIVGAPSEHLSFRKALQALGAPNTVMTIQDQSIPAHEDYNQRCLQGTFAQILEASRSPDGKVLNAFDIGLHGWGLRDDGYASNVAALKATRGQWKTTKALPMEDVNWALAATAGAFHTWHIDCNGFMTFVSPVCGERLCIIGRPRVHTRFKDFADTGLFLKDQYDLARANENLWTLEAMLLKPGDTLVIRPNTPRAFYTPSAAVVHGGHCYARSTLQDSLVGIIHAFMAGALVTNTNHASARFHLQQMIAFYHLALVENSLEQDDARWDHVPDCRVETEYRQLMALCIFGILVNVLDFATYSHPGQLGSRLTAEQRSEMIAKDVNMLSDEERMGCVYTRGQCLQIMDFVTKHYTMKKSKKSKWPDIKSYQDHIIVQQCRMLLDYKLRASEVDLEGAPQCDGELLTVQLQGVLDGEINARIVKALSSAADGHQTMLLPELGVALQVIDPPPQYMIGDPLMEGMSVRDAIYFEARRIKSETHDEEFPLRRKRQKFE